MRVERQGQFVHPPRLLRADQHHALAAGKLRQENVRHVDVKVHEDLGPRPAEEHERHAVDEPLAVRRIRIVPHQLGDVAEDVEGEDAQVRRLARDEVEILGELHRRDRLVDLLARVGLGAVIQRHEFAPAARLEVIESPLLIRRPGAAEVADDHRLARLEIQAAEGGDVDVVDAVNVGQIQTHAANLNRSARECKSSFRGGRADLLAEDVLPQLGQLSGVGDRTQQRQLFAAVLGDVDAAGLRVLGQVQRGGSPTPRDRVLATR